MYKSVFKNNIRTSRVLYRQYSSKYPPPPSYYERKTKYFGKLMLLAFATGATISYNYSLFELSEIYHGIPDAEDEARNALYTMDLESKLQKLPIIEQLKADPKYVHFRAWDQLEETPSGLSQFHGTLAVPGGIAIPPFHFHSQETGEDVVILHVGKRLSGYPMIVHGGMLGMLVDEIFKRNVNSEFAIDVNDIHTTNLEVKYKFPCFVNQFIIIKSQAKKNEDGQFEVSGDVSTINGRLLLMADSKYSSDGKPIGGGPESKGKWFW